MRCAHDGVFRRRAMHCAGLSSGFVIKLSWTVAYFLALAGERLGVESVLDQEEAKRRAKAAPLLLLLRRGFAVGIGFISTITIAHLVGPRAYGLANMSTLVLALAQMFRDFGLTTALLRKGQISNEERSFLFWFNAGMTTVLALLIAALAPAAAVFYKEPVVATILLVSMVGFWIAGISLQHRSLMTRQMRFGEIAMIDAAALAANFVVSLGLALWTHDVWAIVFGSLAQSLTTSFLYFWRARWIPGRPAKTAGMMDLFKFGANTSVFSLSTFLANNIGPVLIGHAMGPSLLGQYNRAQSLYQLPTFNLIQPITQATMPLLTHLRSDPDSYRQAYLELIRKLTTFLIPLAVLLTFASKPLTMVLLGARWADAGVVLGILAPTLAALGLGVSVSDLFVTQDRSGELRTLGLVEMTLRIGACAIGVFFGLIGVSIAYTVSTIIVCVLRVIIAGRTGPVSAKDQFRQILPSLPLAVGSIVGCAAATLALMHFHPTPLVSLVAIFGAGGVIGLGCGIAAPASRRAIFEVFSTFGIKKSLFKRLGGRFSASES
jgi:PST family polysaccharide transporter